MHTYIYAYIYIYIYYVYVGAELSPKGRPRCPKGSHMSNNVYMLVYKRKDHLEGVYNLI